MCLGDNGIDLLTTRNVRGVSHKPVGPLLLAIRLISRAGQTPCNPGLL